MFPSWFLPLFMLIVYSLLSILHTRRDEVIISDWRMWTWTMNMYIKTIIIYRKEWFKLQFACPKSPSYSPSSFEQQPTHCIWPFDPENTRLRFKQYWKYRDDLFCLLVKSDPVRLDSVWFEPVSPWRSITRHPLFTYIVSHQLHDSLFRCNFVEYLSATRIMTDKFTNIMTSHAQSLKKRFLNRLREYSI